MTDTMRAIVLDAPAPPENDDDPRAPGSDAGDRVGSDRAQDVGLNRSELHTRQGLATGVTHSTAATPSTPSHAEERLAIPRRGSETIPLVPRWCPADEPHLAPRLNPAPKRAGRGSAMAVNKTRQGWADSSMSTSSLLCGRVSGTHRVGDRLKSRQGAHRGFLNTDSTHGVLEFSWGTERCRIGPRVRPIFGAGVSVFRAGPREVLLRLFRFQANSGPWRREPPL